jgi:hypothetical protein
MAKLFVEPRVDQCDLNDWINFAARTTAQGRGYMNITLDNMDSNLQPVIKKGSILEIGGMFFIADRQDESVNGLMTQMTQGRQYIYAEPYSSRGSTFEIDGCSFRYSDKAPVWSPEKGGWYGSGVSVSSSFRAIAKLYYNHIDMGYNGKVILDSYNAMYAVNKRQNINEAQSITYTTRLHVTAFTDNEIFRIDPGAYRYEVKGARSGVGGTGYSGNPAASTGKGYNPNTEYDGKVKEGRFFHDGGLLTVSVGQNGGNGGSIDGDGNGGGGGGGGCSKLGTIVARGGQAGKGGNYNRPDIFGGDGKPADDVFGGSGGNYGGTSNGNKTPPTDADNTTNGYVKLYILWN